MFGAFSSQCMDLSGLWPNVWGIAGSLPIITTSNVYTSCLPSSQCPVSFCTSIRIYHTYVKQHQQLSEALEIQQEQTTWIHSMPPTNKSQQRIFMIVAIILRLMTLSHVGSTCGILLPYKALEGPSLNLNLNSENTTSYMWNVFLRTSWRAYAKPYQVEQHSDLLGLSKNSSYITFAADCLPVPVNFGQLVIDSDTFFGCFSVAPRPRALSKLLAAKLMYV